MAKRIGQVISVIAVVILAGAAKAQPAGKLAQGALTWAGARLHRVDADQQEMLGLAETEGLTVAALDPGSAAVKAGLKMGDVLVRINARPVPTDLDGFRKLVKEEKLDEGADLVVVRDGKEETIKSARLPTLVEFDAPPTKRGRGGLGGFAGKAGLRLWAFNGKGASIVRNQSGDEFSGEYRRGDLKITVAGKLDDAMTIAIAIAQGEETRKYTNVKDVPEEHQRIVQQLLPRGR
jgi:hypothetical protein